VPAPLSVTNPIAVMENEHRRAGEAMEQMRRLTNDYTAPPDGCSAFQTLVAGLAELEEDLHQHIHKESHILFPRAEERERSLEVHQENDHASCLAPSRQPADAP
jgi:regulator of cell morphogenesis and NO signaling